MRSDVAVIIPTLNEAEHIANVLQDLDNQTQPPMTVHVIDGGSIDGTLDIVKSFRAHNFTIQTHHNPAKRVPQALNIGYRAATESIIARVDGHCRLSPEYLEGVVGAIRQGYSGSGGVKSAVGETEQGRANAACLNSRFGVGQSPYHFASEPTEVRHVPFGTYTRSTLEQVGGWDERFPVNQDFELDHRIGLMGGRLLVVPTSTVRWKCRESLSGLFRQYRRYGAGKAHVHRAHAGSMGMSQLAAVIAPVAALVLPILGLMGRGKLGRWAPAVYGAAVLAQGTAVRLEARRSSGANAPALWRVGGALLAMQSGYCMGYWEGRLAGVQHGSQEFGPDSSRPKGP